MKLLTSTYIQNDESKMTAAGCRQFASIDADFTYFIFYSLYFNK